MFNRRIYKEVLRWKERYAPRYALFLKGARRVGKTTLAEKLGKDPSTVSKWCSNITQPTLDTLVNIAKVLDVDIKDLINDK